MTRTLQIPTARAYLPFLQPSRYKGAHGGRGSAKSHEFASLLLERCILNPATRWVCVREVQKSLEQSVKRLLEDKIKQFELSDFVCRHTHIETPGDGVIIFQGMQDHTADSIKSLEGFDGAWIEEAQSVSDRSLTLLRPTIRKEGSEIWASWNPDQPTDPIDKLLRGTDRPPNSIVIGTTFADNPWFPAELRAEMEWDRRVDVDKYTHVWLGGYQLKSQARIFKNWRIEEFTAPLTATFFLGADWGFSVDPTTLVRCYEERINPATGVPWPRKRLYIDYEKFSIGVELDYIPSFYDGLICGCNIRIPGTTPAPCAVPNFHGWARHFAIIADSSRPDTISYLRRSGYPLMDAAKKGPNSVREGIMFLQSYDIIVHPRCTHTVDELTHYSFVVDKLSGLVTNEIQDKKNHIIDPMRYSLEQLRGALRVRDALWA